MRRAALILTLGALGALAPAAQAGTGAPPQVVGDPLTYLVQGRPATQLTTLFVLSGPIPAGSSASVLTAGGTTLGTATPASIGTSGLCYAVRFTTSQAVSNGSAIRFALTLGDVALQPEPEAVRTLTAAKARRPALLVGSGSC